MAFIKKSAIQFASACIGAAVGGLAFAFLWPRIDRFFYNAFGIVLECDGCHTASLCLLYIFIPGFAAAFQTACEKVVCGAAGFFVFFRNLAACTALGGTLSLFAVQIASGAAAACLVACCMGISAIAGSVVPRRSS